MTFFFLYQRLCGNDLLYILRFEWGWDPKMSPPSQAYPAPFHTLATPFIRCTLGEINHLHPSMSLNVYPTFLRMLVLVGTLTQQ